MIAESEAQERGGAPAPAEQVVPAEAATEPAPETETAKPEEPAAPTPSRAFELLERSRAEAAKRRTEVAAKRAAMAPHGPVAPPTPKPANAMQALEAGGFSIDDIIRESIAASDQAAADKGTPPAIDQDKLLAAIQERVPQLVEQRVQQVFEQMQRAQIERMEQDRALEMHTNVHEHIASAAAKLPDLAAAAKRDAVAVTEAIVNVYDSVLKATGKKLTMDQAARRLNAILAGDDETIVASAAEKPNARSVTPAGKPGAKPSPVDRRELTWEEEDKAGHQEALDILAGKIPVPKGS